MFLQNGYTSVETTVSKSLPPAPYLYFKKTPPFFIDFQNLTPPHSKHRPPPPLGINNEQSLTRLETLATQATLQSDLNDLVSWSESSGLIFNQPKGK